MKYFILDLKNQPNAYISNGVDALRLATQDEPTEIIQFDHEQFMKYPHIDAISEHMVDELRSSDIIMGFAAQNLVEFWHEGSMFHTALLEKINGRTPFYLQFSQMCENINLHSCEIRNYGNLLDSLNTYPTRIKVRGSDYFEECWAEYKTKFVPAKVDPDISTVFDSRDEIWISDANLMTFGEGNTALLKSSAYHRNVSTLGPDPGPIDYEKHTPFVIRKTQNHFGYLVSGTFFGVNFDSATNPRSVGKANIAAISNIVRELQANVRLHAYA